MSREKQKKVAILYNPISGQGKAAIFLRELEKIFTEVGHSVSSKAIGEIEKEKERLEWLSLNDVLFVLGGDGTMMFVLSSLVETKTPVYMFPSGNESLFGKRIFYESRCTPGIKSSREIFIFSPLCTKDK